MRKGKYQFCDICEKLVDELTPEEQKQEGCFYAMCIECYEKNIGKNTKAFLDERIKLLDKKKINELELKNFVNNVTQIFSDLKEIRLFGSRFNGNPKEDSDYDLIFVFDNNTKYQKEDNGFIDLDVDKFYGILKKYRLDIINNNGFYKFHIFLKEPQLSDGNFLIWKRNIIDFKPKQEVENET